jgi:hypothetical protein
MPKIFNAFFHFFAVLEYALQNSIGGIKRKELATLQRVQPLKKPTADGNTYSSRGTAELKPYSMSAKKFCKKLDILFLPYFFTFTVSKSVEEHLIKPETTRDAYLGLVLYIKKYLNTSGDSE